MSSFTTHVPFGSEEYYNYDLREPKRKIINPDKIRETKKTLVTTNDWSNIPYYPTTKERNENQAKQLMSMGKQIPQGLLRQIEIDKQNEINNDAFNKFNLNHKEAQRIKMRPPPPKNIAKTRMWIGKRR